MEYDALSKGYSVRVTGKQDVIEPPAFSWLPVPQHRHHAAKRLPSTIRRYSLRGTPPSHEPRIGTCIPVSTGSDPCPHSLLAAASQALSQAGSPTLQFDSNLSRLRYTSWCFPGSAVTSRKLFANPDFKARAGLPSPRLLESVAFSLESTGSQPSAVGCTPRCAYGCHSPVSSPQCPITPSINC